MQEAGASRCHHGWPAAARCQILRFRVAVEDKHFQRFAPNTLQNGKRDREAPFSDLDPVSQTAIRNRAGVYAWLSTALMEFPLT
jgi:hypothetical protein